MNLDRIKQLAGIFETSSISDADSVFDVDRSNSTLEDEQPEVISFNHNFVDLSTIEVGGVDTIDYPDFADAYISYAAYVDGTPLTDVELDRLSDENRDLINQLAHNNIYENSSVVQEKAPPGMEDTVLQLKKEYPGDESRAFATAWSIYNKKHGKTNEASGDFYYSVFGFDPESNKWFHHFDADDKDDAQDEIRSMRDQGTQAKIFRVPVTQAQWDKTDPNQFVMSKLGMAESVPAVKSCKQSNPVSADVACAMEESMSEYDSNFIGSAIRQLYQFATSENELRNMVAGETGYGINPEFNSTFSMELSKFLNTNLEDEFGPEYGGEEFDEDVDDAERMHGNALRKIETLIKRSGYKDGEIAAETGNDLGGDASTALEIFRAYRDAHPELIDNEQLYDRMCDAYDNAYREGIMGISEAFDIQNGYKDRKTADLIDYFPDGADSPVVDKTGPSGARQGDNPEQKKMQIKEVHKDLVHSYRKHLQESNKKKLNEDAIQIIRIENLYKVKNGKPIFDTIYTATDGKGNYPLTNDGSVFFSIVDNEHIRELDGKPHSTSDEEYIFLVDGKLGVYDNNLKLLRSYDDIRDVLYDIEYGNLPYVSVETDW